MRFRNPGGDLVWLTPLLFVCGIVIGFVEFQNGNAFLAAVVFSMGLLSGMVWLDMKWVAYPLMAYFSLAVLGGTIALIVQGFAWSLLVKTIMAGYSVLGFWEWLNKEDE